MVTKQIDALTLSFLSIREIDTSQALNNVLDILKLSDVWGEFELVGRDKYYPYVFRYNDVSICICREDRLHKQGICVRFSGNGLAWYCDFLCKHGLKLRNICRAWRASAVNGDFTRCTRFDFAIDDFCTNNDTPLVTMRKVRNCVKNREFRSRLLAQRPLKSQLIQVSDDFSSRCDDDAGDTIYFGNRRSSTFCRFYDKLLESSAHGSSVSSDVTSWVRCEFEFKDARAMGVFNDFCDMDESGFSERMSKVFNNYICFIKKDNVVRSRCTTKRWWVSFLGTAERASITMPPYKPRTFKGNSEWFQNIAPSMYIYIATVGLRYFLDMIVKYGKDRVTAKHKQVQRDFIYEFCRNDKGGMDEDVKSCANAGLDYWLLTNGRSKKAAMKAIQEDHKRFCTVNGMDWKKFSSCVEGKQLSFSSAYVAPERDVFDDDLLEAFCSC